MNDDDTRGNGGDTASAAPVERVVDACGCQRARQRPLVAIICDRERGAEALAQHLRGQGWEPVIWLNSETVLAQVRAVRPDIIVLQIPASMPLFERWRRTAPIGSVPVIPCTGIDDPLCIQALHQWADQR